MSYCATPPCFAAAIILRALRYRRAAPLPPRLHAIAAIFIAAAALDVTLMMPRAHAPPLRYADMPAVLRLRHVTYAPSQYDDDDTRRRCGAMLMLPSRRLPSFRY